MAIVSYTTFNDVRAVLGVSDDELEDATLSLSVYADSLDLELLAIGATLPSLFTATQNKPLGDRTADEKVFLMQVAQFATYHVANEVGQALPMMPKTISDGKANMSRFADAPYRLTMERIKSKYDALHNALEEIYATLAGTSATSAPLPTLLVGAGASIDRVTNS